jgi:hypothetical protein
MSSSGTRIGLVLAALLLAVTACQAGTPQARTSPKPTTSASASASADAQRCARLAKRGFTPCPPLASQLQLPTTTIKNATNGAIDDATAQKWGRAFQLGQAYYYWVIDQNAREALTSGVLADTTATDTLFGNDLQELDQAKQEGGILVQRPPGLSVSQIVAVPPDLQQAMSRQGLTPKDFAIAVRFVGPQSRSIRFPDGHQKDLVSVGQDYVTTAMTWGALQDDRDLGPIWYENGYYGCEGTVKSVCQL